MGSVLDHCAKLVAIPWQCPASQSPLWDAAAPCWASRTADELEAGGGMPVTIGRLRARTDLGDIRHVKLEARRGARSRGTGRVEQVGSSGKEEITTGRPPPALALPQTIWTRDHGTLW